MWPRLAPNSPEAWAWVVLFPLSLGSDYKWSIHSGIWIREFWDWTQDYAEARQALYWGTSQPQTPLFQWRDSASLSLRVVLFPPCGQFPRRWFSCLLFDVCTLGLLQCGHKWEKDIHVAFQVRDFPPNPSFLSGAYLLVSGNPPVCFLFCFWDRVTPPA